MPEAALSHTWRSVHSVRVASVLRSLAHRCCLFGADVRPPRHLSDRRSGDTSLRGLPPDPRPAHYVFYEFKRAPTMFIGFHFQQLCAARWRPARAGAGAAAWAPPGAGGSRRPLQSGRLGGRPRLSAARRPAHLYTGGARHEPRPLQRTAGPRHAGGCGRTTPAGSCPNCPSASG